MIKSALRITALLSALYGSVAYGQSAQPVIPLVGGAAVSGSNPLPISGSFSASLGGFTPSAAGARGTPLSVTNADSSGNLPTGTVVIVSNVGTNLMHCNVNGIAATASDQPITTGGGWFAFTIPMSVTTLHCIAPAGTATANSLGGSGLPTGTGGGGGGGGGSSGAVFGPTAAGSAAANPPVIIGGTVDGTAAGNVANWKVTGGIGSINTAQVNGVTTLAGAGAVGTGAQRVAVGQDATTLAGSALGLTVGSPLFISPGTGASFAVTNAGTFATQLTGSTNNVIAAQATGSNLHMVCDSGCASSGGTSSTFGAAFPATGTALGLTNGTNMVAWSATTNYGTGPGAIAVPAVNAAITNTPTVNAVLGTESTKVIGTVNQGTNPWIVTANIGTSGSLALEAGNLGTLVTDFGAPGATACATDTASCNLNQQMQRNNQRLTSILAASSGFLDANAFTQGPAGTAMAPSGCLYTTSVTNLTTGQAGVARCTNDRQQLVSDAALLTAAQAGTGLTGVAVPASAIYVGANALSAEPTATTTGDLTGYFIDLAGKTVTSPYANRENMLRCAVTITSSTSPTTCTGMGAQGSNVKIYVTDLTCTRSDGGTTAAQATLNDSATTAVDMPNNGGGGGYAHSYLVPLVVAANTAFQITTASLASVHCSATGFKGY